jgi:two-component system cell cycle sensor histidine kinase/response regulator CckA
VRVLVVDDEAMVRSVSARILEAEGAAVQEADDGIRALERIEAEPTAFDLVLLDMTMPNMGGAETLVALRERGHRLPVLLSSGFSAAALPSDDTTSFIAKPFRALELVTAVRRALERAAAVGV